MKIKQFYYAELFFFEKQYSSNMKKIFENILGQEKAWEFWKQVAASLDRKDLVLRISDFDNTLFSRQKQLSEIEWLRLNRADRWPKFLFEQYGMKRFIDQYYVWQTIPTEILSQMNPQHDIIITAWWYKDFQKAKVRAIRQLDEFQTVYTHNWEEKIPELIRYVLFELRYIPTEIRVYEDRPEYFLEYRELIQDTLWTQLKIFYVEMDRNDWYKKIEEI